MLPGGSTTLTPPWSWNVQFALVAIKDGALALKTLESQQGGKLGTLWSFHNGRAQRVQIRLSVALWNRDGTNGFPIANLTSFFPRRKR